MAVRPSLLIFLGIPILAWGIFQSFWLGDAGAFVFQQFHPLVPEPQSLQHDIDAEIFRAGARDFPHSNYGSLIFSHKILHYHCVFNSCTVYLGVNIMLKNHPQVVTGQNVEAYIAYLFKKDNQWKVVETVRVESRLDSGIEVPKGLYTH